MIDVKWGYKKLKINFSTVVLFQEDIVWELFLANVLCIVYVFPVQCAIIFCWRSYSRVQPPPHILQGLFFLPCFNHHCTLLILVSFFRRWCSIFLWLKNSTPNNIFFISFKYFETWSKNIFRTIKDQLFCPLSIECIINYIRWMGKNDTSFCSMVREFLSELQTFEKECLQARCSN